MAYSCYQACTSIEHRVQYHAAYSGTRLVLTDSAYVGTRSEIKELEDKRESLLQVSQLCVSCVS
eukprot:3455262-Rhodomonas_salina.1